MGNGLHRVFSKVVKETSQELTPLGESGSEVSHFILEPRNFDEVKKLSENIKKPWLKANIKEIKNLISNHTFLIEDQNEGEPVTPCMDVYRAKNQSDGSLDKLKLRILVRGDLYNKKMVGDTRSPTASMSTLKYFLADAAKHKARFHQLNVIREFLQARVKNRVFVKLDIRYTDYFPEYAKYFGRDLRLLEPLSGMNNSEKLFADELIEWLLKSGFIQLKCQMYIYYKYAPDGSNIIVLYYVDDCLYFYTNEDLGKWFVDTLGKRLHVNFLGYAHCLMSIIFLN